MRKFAVLNTKRPEPTWHRTLRKARKRARLAARKGTASSLQLRRLSEHHGSSVPRARQYHGLLVAMAPWGCRFCEVQNFDDRTKCRVCGKSKKFAEYDQSKVDAAKARRNQDGQQKGSSNRAPSQPNKRGESNTPKRKVSKPPRRVAELEKKLQVERERAEKAEKENKQLKTTSDDTPMELDEKAEPSIAKVVQFKRGAEKMFGKDHHVVSKLEDELVELREQRDQRLPLRTKITRLDADIKRISKSIDTQASIVAGIQEEVNRQLALADEAKAKEVQLRADLSGVEAKRRDALRSEAAMPISAKDYANKSWLLWLDEHHPTLVGVSKSASLTDEQKEEILEPARLLYNKHAADDQAVLEECKATGRTNESASSNGSGADLGWAKVPPKLTRQTRKPSPARPKQGATVRSTPYEGRPKAAELQAALQLAAMRLLFKESFPEQEIPNDETLKKHWEGSSQSDKESCVNKITAEYEANKKKVTIAIGDDGEEQETFEPAEDKAN